MANAVLEQRLVGGVFAITLLFAVVLAVLMVVGIGCLVSDIVRRRREARQIAADAETRRALYARLNDYAHLDPELSEGFCRLDAAVRNEQKGEQP